MAKASSRARAAVKESKATARRHRLRYVNDGEPGISRRQQGGGFIYLDTRNQRVKSKAILSRIKSLAIPPAWTDVWICPHENGHMQATGRDARKRKQYRYHPLWREARDSNKFDHLRQFARVLPRIRARVRRQLSAAPVTRQKVLATVVSLLEKSLIRVGNEEYASANGSHGLTTMRDGHVKIRDGGIRFQFKGKGGKRHEVRLNNAKLARTVKRCQELPGQRLFQYLDEEGGRHAISSSDVNEYLREISGAEISAKDFRTWAGTVLAAMALREFEQFDTQTQAKRNILAAIESVAKRLGNTPAICRKCYIHPSVLDSYVDQSMLRVARQRARMERKLLKDLRPEEAFTLALLERRLKRETL